MEQDEETILRKFMEIGKLIQDFADLEVAKEREACAEIVSSKKYLHIPKKNQLWLLLSEISDDIRARGQA
jgi:hypothetical protein